MYVNFPHGMNKLLTKEICFQENSTKVHVVECGAVATSPQAPTQEAIHGPLSNSSLFPPTSSAESVLCFPADSEPPATPNIIRATTGKLTYGLNVSPSRIDANSANDGSVENSSVDEAQTDEVR